MGEIIDENKDFWLKGVLNCKKTTKTPQYLWGIRTRTFRTNVLYTDVRKQAFVHICFSGFSSITEKLLKSTICSLTVLRNVVFAIS